MAYGHWGSAHRWHWLGWWTRINTIWGLEGPARWNLLLFHWSRYNLALGESPGFTIYTPTFLPKKPVAFFERTYLTWLRNDEPRSYFRNWELITSYAIPLELWHTINHIPMSMPWARIGLPHQGEMQRSIKSYLCGVLSINTIAKCWSITAGFLNCDW